MNKEIKLALLQRKLELILLVTHPIETRRYREARWRGTLQLLKAHPIASAIRQVDRDLEKIMSNTLQDDEISSIHAAIEKEFDEPLIVPELDIIKKVLTADSIENDEEAFLLRDYLSNPPSGKIDNGSLKKLRMLLAKYETREA